MSTVAQAICVTTYGLKRICRKPLLTLEEDPGVFEYLSEYIFIMSERLIDATRILPHEIEALPV
jgi:hypothetical protein